MYASVPRRRGLRVVAVSALLTVVFGRGARFSMSTAVTAMILFAYAPETEPQVRKALPVAISDYQLIPIRPVVDGRDCLHKAKASIEPRAGGG